MGARDRKGPLDEHWRKKIQTGVLLDRLGKHVLGSIEMTPTQVQAARILLAKAVPDLKAIEHTGPEGGPMQHKAIVEHVRTPDQGS